MLRDFPRNARLLMGARAARSVGQGALVADFALYLHALHWSALAIGILYSLSLLVGAAATLLVGPLSDHFGAKGFLLGYEGVQLVAASIALSTTQPIWLGGAAILGAFGRGANGGAGPFAPAEQSWISRSVVEPQWAPIFHFNTSIGLSGMAAGALLAALPSVFEGMLPGAAAYRPLFLIVLIGSVVCLLFLRAAEALPAERATEEKSTSVEAATAKTQQPLWRLMLTFGSINTLNGLGIGMVGPLMAYWFHLRFGIGPAAIGGTMAIAFASAAFMSLIGLRLTRRFGLVGTVLRMRLLGLALLLALPFSPFFWLAMLIFIIRAALNQGNIGSRQTLFLGLVDKDRRGLAATINSLSIQAPRAIGPTIAAAFFQWEMLVTPFLIAGALQGAYLYFFQRFFKGIEKKAR